MTNYHPTGWAASTTQIRAFRSRRPNDGCLERPATVPTMTALTTLKTSVNVNNLMFFVRRNVRMLRIFILHDRLRNKLVPRILGPRCAAVICAGHVFEVLCFAHYDYVHFLTDILLYVTTVSMIYVVKPDGQSRHHLVSRALYI